VWDPSRWGTLSIVGKALWGGKKNRNHSMKRKINRWLVILQTQVKGGRIRKTRPAACFWTGRGVRLMAWVGEKALKRGGKRAWYLNLKRQGGTKEKSVNVKSHHKKKKRTMERWYPS